MKKIILSKIERCGELRIKVVFEKRPDLIEKMKTILSKPEKEKKTDM